MLRAAPTTTRARQKTSETTPWTPVTRTPTPAVPVLTGVPLGRLDWSGIREGAREVFLTLAATLAFGLTWAAIEIERLGAPAEVPGPVAAAAAAGAPGVETGYASARGTGR